MQKRRQKKERSRALSKIREERGTEKKSKSKTWMKWCSVVRRKRQR
jgi:hypothetical protein